MEEKKRGDSMRIITVCIQRGGAGKTSTAWAIATGAALRGKKALAIDFDPQGSLSFIMGAVHTEG